MFYIRLLNIFLLKNERIAYFRSFPLFWWAMWAIRSQSLIFGQKTSDSLGNQMSKFPALQKCTISLHPQVQYFFLSDCGVLVQFPCIRIFQLVCPFIVHPISKCTVYQRHWKCLQCTSGLKSLQCTRGIEKNYSLTAAWTSLQRTSGIAKVYSAPGAVKKLTVHQ